MSLKTLAALLPTLSAIVILVTILCFGGEGTPTGRRVSAVSYTTESESVVVGFGPSYADTNRRYTAGLVWRLSTKDFKKITGKKDINFITSRIIAISDDAVMIVGTYCENKGGGRNVWSSALLVDFGPINATGTLYPVRSNVPSNGQSRGGGTVAVSPNLRFWAFGSKSYLNGIEYSNQSPSCRITVRQSQKEEWSWNDIVINGPGHGVFPSRKQVDLTAMAFSPDSQQLVSGGEDARVIAWLLDYDARTMTERLSLDEYKGAVIALGFNTPTSLVSVDTVGRVITREWPSGKVVKQTELAIEQQVGPYGAIFAPDGKQLVVWGGGEVRLVDPATHVVGLTFSQKATDASCAGFSHDGKRVTIGFASPLDAAAAGRIEEYDTTTGRLTQSREF